ncbi:MAG: helicase-associated domain-containing protein, partial [Planctomycetota bacterium]
MSPSRNGSSATKPSGGIVLHKHLQALRVGDLRDVHAFWCPDEGNGKRNKRELVSELEHVMSQEGVVYRRVRTLTRKVLEVLLLLLRRQGYTSDLPGLFQRLPGEGKLGLEYHEAEAGVKALRRRGFLAELSDRRMATNGRVLYAVPGELGRMLTSLFREETRTVASVFTLGEFAATITATERATLGETFPALEATPSSEDARRILGKDGADGLVARLDPAMQDVVEYVVDRHGGLMTRANWASRRTLRDIRWNRERWCAALEAAAVGTVARISLRDYGIACDDGVVVIFREVLEDLFRRRSGERPACDEVLCSGGDLVADLCAFLEHVGRHPVKVGKKGEVHKASRRRIQDGFVYRETFLAGPREVWAEIFGAATTLGLVRTDGGGFLELTPEAKAFLAKPLEGKAHELYHVALEQAGRGARSLHQREIRTLVSDTLRDESERWWAGRPLAAVSRHRYLSTLDERGIQARHRDRHFSAYFSGRESPRDLLSATEHNWLKRLHVLGLLDVAVKNERPIAWRLSPLGARVLGAETRGLETGLEPLLVNPDFEVVVLPEGDVSDVVHTLDGWAQRVKSGEVVHFRLTRASVQAAVGGGRSIEDLLVFLEARSHGTVPQNVAYTLKDWAGQVTFATLERGVVLTVRSEAALEMVLALPEMARLLLRRLGPTEVLLKQAPEDRRLLASLREEGI